MYQIKLIVSIALIFIITTVTGCATTEGEGALVGGLLGATAGALSCKGSSEDRAKCIAAAAVIGGGVGYVAGKVLENEKKKYANDEDFYNAQIGEIAQLNKDISTKNKDLRKSISNDQRQIKTLMAQYKKGQISKEQLTAAKTTYDQKLAAANTDLSKFKKEVEFKEKVVAEMRNNAKVKQSQIKKLQAGVDKSKSNVERVQQNVNLMAQNSSTVHL